MNWVTLVLCNILIVPKNNPITPLISNLPRIFFSFHSVSLTCPGKWFILSLLRLIMGTTHAHTSDTWQYDIVGCSSSDLQQPPKRRNNISRCHTGIFHFKRFEEEKSCKRMLYAILHQVYRDQMGSISSPLLRLLLETPTRGTATVSSFDSFLCCDVVVKMSGETILLPLYDVILGRQCFHLFFRG